MAAKVVKPEAELSALFSRWVFGADDDHVDGVGVADEVIVGDEVRLVAGEVKETQIASIWTTGTTTATAYTDGLVIQDNSGEPAPETIGHTYPATITIRLSSLMSVCLFVCLSVA